MLVNNFFSNPLSQNYQEKNIKDEMDFKKKVKKKQYMDLCIGFHNCIWDFGEREKKMHVCERRKLKNGKSVSINCLAHKLEFLILK